MASSLINTLFGKVAFAIVDESFDYPRWGGLKILNVDIMLDSSIIDQPVAVQEGLADEGFISLLEIDISNGKIIQPVKVRVRAIAPNLSTVEGLMSGFVDSITTYSITSRSVISSSMYMTDLQIIQTPDNLSSTEVVIEWEQSAIPANLPPFTPDNPANNSKFGVRVQKPAEGIPNQLRGFASSIRSGADALFEKVTSIL